MGQFRSGGQGQPGAVVKGPSLHPQGTDVFPQLEQAIFIQFKGLC
jgi:hypothetical protein